MLSKEEKLKKINEIIENKETIKLDFKNDFVRIITKDFGLVLSYEETLPILKKYSSFQIKKIKY